ncbi:MAG: CBS domain-containing protein [Proteobacteria bacterium]|nr:CBS domain-containing protein [Pseudomonadota bacterium]MBU4276380.1 CBS domain-containing protein [Pseudomonadota bacterium]MBU4383719.1 CBS domain-containing protein [Pseudomonadota bacterium]MBU4605864.1 CBS domain-containing protein [Pseudomonadota bacterium]MCG2763941.1 CBS domain-containing protein [Desulfarculaceae bacterium]
MIVANRMSPNPWTISQEASVAEALELMQTHGVRHLPVVEDGLLVGLVTDIDLRTAYFASLLEELKVRDVMSHEPMVIDGGDTVFQAARLIHKHKLTGLPVVENGRLVGIITLADILGVFVALLGLLEDSTRLDVALKPGSEALEEVYAIIRKQGGEVISVAQLSSDVGRRIYTFRLKKTELEPLVKVLQEAGHGVLL